MTELFTTAALLGIGTTVLYQLKALPSKLFNKVKGRYIYTVRVYQYDELFTALESYMKDHHIQRFKDVEAFISDNPLGEGCYTESANKPHDETR